jgi:hypothetical protein
MMTETTRHNLRTGITLAVAFVAMLIGSVIYIVTFK